jgi:hypothetical protein
VDQRLPRSSHEIGIRQVCFDDDAERVERHVGNWGVVEEVAIVLENALELADSNPGSLVRLARFWRRRVRRRRWATSAADRSPA